MVNNGPCYLKNKLPRFRKPLYSRINVNSFHGIGCKSDRYMNSFFPDGINSWNKVITHFKTIPSIDILKRHILSLVRPERKSIFGIHDPFWTSKPFSIKSWVKFLSKISQKSHNFIDTPSDKCSCVHNPEDTNHFLLPCPLYVACRAPLITNEMKILQKYNLHYLKANLSYTCMAMLRHIMIF